MILYGCQEEVENQEVKLIKINVSEMKDFGKVNNSFFVTYDDEQVLQAFHLAFSSAEKQPGIVNMALGDFDVEFEYSDGTKEGYHLWLGKKGSTIMNVNDTHTIYTISEQNTKPLLALFK